MSSVLYSPLLWALCWMLWCQIICKHCSNYVISLTCNYTKKKPHWLPGFIYITALFSTWRGLVKQNYTKCTVFGLVWHITRRGKYNMAYGKVRQKYTGCIACVVIRQNYTTRMVGPYMAWLNLKTKRAAQFIMV